MDVLVGSKSRHKLAAVTQTLGEIFSGEEKVEVIYQNVPSQVNAQPVGHEETVRGALNRMEGLKNIIKGIHFDLLVAFENGIYSVQIDGRLNWFDVGWVVVEDGRGNRALAHSAGVQVEKRDVDEAERCGFVNNTVGNALAERTGAEPTDPHVQLTNGLVDRTDLLSGALRVAIGQLLGQDTLPRRRG